MLGMAGGAVTLGAVARRTAMLVVACGRCPRRGRLRIDRLLTEHGPLMSMPALRYVIAADCPRIAASQPYDQCGIHYPQLAGMFLTTR